MKKQKTGLLSEFEGSAAQPLGSQHEIRDTLRVFMETSNAPVPPPHEFDPFTYDPEADTPRP